MSLKPKRFFILKNTALKCIPQLFIRLAYLVLVVYFNDDGWRVGLDVFSPPVDENFFKEEQFVPGWRQGFVNHLRGLAVLANNHPVNHQVAFSNVCSMFLIYDI